MINYSSIPEFDRDFKRLSKKWNTLNEDIETLKKNTVELYHLKKINNRAIFPIPGFCSEDFISNKIKKFACRSLKGSGVNSGLRVIYVYEEVDGMIEITFIEIYHKNEKKDLDRERLTSYISVLKEKYDKTVDAEEVEEAS